MVFGGEIGFKRPGCRTALYHVLCVQFRKRLAVQRNGWKFGSRSPRNSMWRVLFRSGHLSSVWGHSVHFGKFLMLRFSKGHCSHSFHSISTKPYRQHIFGKNMGYCFFWLSKFKSIRRFEDNLPQLYIASIHKLSYSGFIWQQVKQNVKAHGALVLISIFYEVFFPFVKICGHMEQKN